MSRIWIVIAAVAAVGGVAAVAADALLSPRRSSDIAAGPAGPISPAEADIIIGRARALNSAALLVVAEGEEVLGWGDVDRPFDVRSIRKSINNLIIGRLVLEGRLDLDATLEDLGVDDAGFRLNAAERSATVRQLMEGRSGVYHLAAREMRSEEMYRPSRGQYAPGEFWYYNNWDFNALETIAAQAAGHADFCETFAVYAAPALGVDDPESRCVVQLEEKKSRHGAHKLSLSARELARFAAIYHNDGMDGDVRLLPEGWTAWSAEPVSHFHFIDDSKFNYGRLFWSLDPYAALKERSYMARGAGSQYVWLMPEKTMTVIHLVRTRPLFLRKRLGLIPDDNDAWTLGGVIAAAAAGGDMDPPRLY